jgi:potassium uptake TrkH family protein
MIVTFGAMIGIGTLLLKMPRATLHDLSWLDAFFTSTSAVCVTGLNVVDTETTFTTTGQVIILLLIQVGGLGVMTLTTFLAAIFGSISLRGRVLLQDLLSEDNLGRIGRTLPLMFLMTIAFEAAGAWALHEAMAGCGDPRGSSWFAAVFHSISAFCNAGFSIWSGGLYDPVVRGNAAVQSIIMTLIVAGGLGFPVVYATGAWIGGRAARVVGRRKRRVVLTLHARLAWLTTLILIVGGALGLWLTQAGHPRQDETTARWMEALFNSITARTAGFNVGPIEALTPASAVLMLFLMFIGGSPGGTAGGVRTTVLAVALLNARRIILGHDDVVAFRRRISEDLVARSLAVIFLALTWVFFATIVLALVQPAIVFGDLLFEVVSAVSTVGLTRAVTPQLNVVGKLIIILTMFVGRISVLYCVLVFIRRRESPPYRLPAENVIVS